MDYASLATIPQVYWDKALGYFNAGQSAPTAIQNLYFDWKPPFDLNALAAIIGALYADTYWAANAAEGQKLSVTNLAADISSAIGINKADAQKAAQWAFSRWYGLFVRANTNNSGEIPKQGTLTASPDVLVNGGSSLIPKIIISNWNQTYWGPQPGLKNYAYGRAQSLNIGVAIKTPAVSMYYTDAGFVPPPSTWVQCYTFDGNQTSTPLVDINGNSDPVAPGTRLTNAEAFGVNFPGSGHYCMITAASTEFFSNKPDAGQGNWDSATWLQYNGAAGWHNMDVSKTGQASLKFYNHDSEPARFAFEAHYHKLPTDSRVSLSSKDVLKTNDVRIMSKFQIQTVEVEVGGNHVGELDVEFGILPADASVSFFKFWIVPRNHPRHREAALMVGDYNALFTGDAVRVPMGDFTFVGAIR